MTRAEMEEQMRDAGVIAGIASRFLRELEEDLQAGLLPVHGRLFNIKKAVEDLEIELVKVLEMRLEMDRRVLEVAEAILGRKVT